MKAMIDSFGRLHLIRENIHSQWLPQSCYKGGAPQDCGVFCPLFGEPTEASRMEGSKIWRGWQLPLCDKTLLLSSIKIEGMSQEGT